MPEQQAARDLRLDFFRGLALWFIFIDHVPSTQLGQWTLRNFGFSDATEIFVFISGYSAAMVYGRQLERQGFAYMTASVWRRSLQLYVAHIMLTVLYAAQVAFIAARFDNPMYIEELNVTRFFEHPDVALMEALLLHLRPVNLDILPLYIVLLFFFPPILWLIRSRPSIALVLSAVVYTGAQRYDWTWPVYADGDSWFFNPLGWQLLFVMGAWAATRPPGFATVLKWRGWLAASMGVYLVFSLWLAQSWQHPWLDATVPDWIGRWLYPIDKTNLDLLRLLHFLCLAYLVAQVVKPTASFLRARVSLPIILCGQHSLYVFCLGIYLSFAAHFILVQFDDDWWMQLLVILAGLLLMCLLAGLLRWYRRRSVWPVPRSV